MSKKVCSKCRNEFECCCERMGCWCEGYSVSMEKLQQLKENYENCLCEECLKAYAEIGLKIE